ncbi:hypothetical protein LSAT2_015328 [Lamellibrachia satsuma]|nr:hypothetical protein LSAT2_015328 [Lamellibrachia satsuma]
MTEEPFPGKASRSVGNYSVHAGQSLALVAPDVPEDPTLNSSQKVGDISTGLDTESQYLVPSGENCSEKGNSSDKCLTASIIDTEGGTESRGKEGTVTKISRSQQPSETLNNRNRSRDWIQFLSGTLTHSVCDDHITEIGQEQMNISSSNSDMARREPDPSTRVEAIEESGLEDKRSTKEQHIQEEVVVCSGDASDGTDLPSAGDTPTLESLILRRSEWNCEESTCANDRQVNEYLNEAENATSSSVIAQYITRTSTLCSRCSQQERKVDSSTVADAGHMTAEKATECVILNRPTVDQCCETAKPDTRDVSVQTSAEIQPPETGTTFDHQPHVFIATQSTIAPSKVKSPTEMLTKTLDDADAKSGQNERTGQLVETRKTADQGVIVQSSTRPFKAKSPAEMLTQTFDDADTKSERDKEFGHLVDTGKTPDQCVIVQSSVTPPNVTVVKSEIGQLVEHCRTIFTEGVNETKVAVENTSLSQTDTVPAARISFTPPGNEGTQHESLCLPGDHRAAVVAGRPVCLPSTKQELSSTVAISPSLETAQDEKVQSLSLVSRLRHRLRDKLKSIQSS